MPRVAVLPEASKLRLRPAELTDAEAIAALHAASWRATYRGSLGDSYLDGPIDAERRAFWTTRLTHPQPGLVTLVAEAPDGAIVGFVCAFRDHDPRWGTLVDNLHVDPARKGSGLGRRLMRALGETLLQERADGPIHLFVLRANTQAAAFYHRLGGVGVEEMMKTEPDGSTLPVSRIAWTSLDSFVAGAGQGAS